MFVKEICFLPSIFARNVKLNMHLIIDVLSPFFLDSLASRICISEDIMGKVMVNAFLHIKVTVNICLGIFDL